MTPTAVYYYLAVFSQIYHEIFRTITDHLFDCFF